MKSLLPIAAALMLAGCSSVSSQRPLVDLEGVDLAKYQRDMAACEDETASQLVVAGNGVSRCMQAKGYKILRWN